eukprot:970144-Prymnesium_polylepis.1
MNDRRSCGGVVDAARLGAECKSTSMPLRTRCNPRSATDTPRHWGRLQHDRQSDVREREDPGDWPFQDMLRPDSALLGQRE